MHGEINNYNIHSWFIQWELSYFAGAYDQVIMPLLGNKQLVQQYYM